MPCSGTGLLGAGFGRRLLSQGSPLQVWNRAKTKAQALRAHGAPAFAHAANALAGAVAGADRVRQGR